MSELLFRLNEWLGVSTCLEDPLLSRDIKDAADRIAELEDALISIEQVSTEPRIKEWAKEALEIPLPATKQAVTNA